MEIAVLVLAVVAAVLVIACGIWVAVVLVATVTRAKRSPGPITRGRAAERPNP